MLIKVIASRISLADIKITRLTLWGLTKCRLEFFAFKLDLILENISFRARFDLKRHFFLFISFPGLEVLKTVIVEIKVSRII